MTSDEWKATIDRWRERTDGRVGALEQSSAAEEVHRTNTAKRLSSIEDTLKWLVRLILGALVLGLIGFALQGGFNVV